MSGLIEGALESRYRKAADGLNTRLKVFKLYVVKAREKGESEIRLKLPEFWESDDEIALAEFESARAELLGYRLLLPEVADEP